MNVKVVISSVRFYRSFQKILRVNAEERIWSSKLRLSLILSGFSVVKFQCYIVVGGPLLPLLKLFGLKHSKAIDLVHLV